MELDLRPASLTVTAPREALIGATPAGAATQPNLEIILDASGSMVATVGAKTRMAVAKEVLRGVIKSLPGSGVNVALRVYGTASKSARDCKDSKLLVPLGAIDKKALLAAVDSVHASGYTPIAYSLEQAQADLPAGGANSLVLITDGLESCGGDPCAIATRLAAQGHTTRSFVVGFGLRPSQAKLVQCIGKYYPASSQAELKKALGSILKASFKQVLGTVIVYPAGARTPVVAKGALGDRLGFVAGTYDVVIDSAGGQVVWSGLVIDKDLVVPLADKPE
jgi:Ca-activated chloride channel family protein